jgi:hypothetical protein
MNIQTLKICAIALIACAVSFNADGKNHKNPYYLAGYNQNPGLLMNLGPVFLQESPSSPSYKAAFANLQEFFRGLSACRQICDCDCDNQISRYVPAWELVLRECVLESPDFATTLGKLGEQLVGYAEIVDRDIVMVPVKFCRELLVQADEKSPAFKQAQGLFTKIIASLIAVIEKKGTFLAVRQALHGLSKLGAHFSAHSNKAKIYAHIYRGYQKSVTDFPWQTNISAVRNPHSAVLIGYQQKLLKLLFDVPAVVARTGSYSKSVRDLGQLLIKLGNELKKLS